MTTGTRSLGLCWGTVAHAGLLELTDAAASAGFDWISVNPQQYVECPATDAEIRQRLDDAGVVIHQVDPLLCWLPGLAPIPGGGLLAYGPDDVLSVADAVGARRINAAVGFAGDWSLDVITDSLASICDRAAAYDVAVTLEFLPWSRVRDLSTAADVVRRSNAANAGVLFDVWHFHRGGGAVDELDTADLALVRDVQVSDAAREPTFEPMTEAMSLRLMPGVGAIPLAPLLRRLLTDSDASVGVEVFNNGHADRPVTAIAAEAMRTMTALGLVRRY